MKKVILKIASFPLFTGFILLLLMSGQVKAALPVPVVKCISVVNNGSISVSWTVEPGSFDGIRIYYKNLVDLSGGTFDIGSSIISTQVPVTNALSDGYEVYLKTFKSNSPPIPEELSDESLHAFSIKLDVSNVSDQQGIARLSWNRINAAFNGNYTIWRSLDGVIFNDVGTTTDLNYDDILNGSQFCMDDTQVYYKIEYNDAAVGSSNCNSFSTIASGLFKDDNPPEDPVLSYVTMNNGLAEIRWAASTSPDVASYIVELKDASGAWNIIGNLPVTNGNKFIHNPSSTLIDPCNTILTYAVRAVDICGNESDGDINYLKPHNNIVLSGETESTCGRSAVLTWNAYQNMDPPVSKYIIYRREVNSTLPLEFLHEVSAEELTYTDNTINPNMAYLYKVTAENGIDRKISSSCELEITATPESLDNFDMNYITVANNDHIELFANANPAAVIQSLAIGRSSTDGGSLSNDEMIPWDGSNPVEVADFSAEVNSTSYYYTITAFDACNFPLATTTVFRSIFLQIAPVGNDRYRLSWNAFEGWDDTYEYQVFRVVDGVVDAAYPELLSFNQLVFVDNISGVLASSISYYVEAVRIDDGVRSRSNEVQISADTQVKLPTAFKPGSDNSITNTFKPLLRFFDAGSYSLMIYNRWGQQVFSTNDPTKGWDGLVNGNEASAGLYAWVLTFNDLNGNKTTEKGAVMLLR